MKTLITLLCLLFPVIAHAEAPISMGYNNGKNYAQVFSDSQRATYAQGLINGITLHKVFKDEKTYAAFMRCTGQMKAGDIGEVIRQYIVSHPKQQHMNLNVLSIYALNEACSGKYK